MINVQVRPADLNDHQRLSNLIFFETRSHRHLDWRSPLEWLGDDFFWTVEEGAQLTAALACPVETDGIAWVRLFVHAGYWSAENAWTILWDAAQADIARAGGMKVAAIVQQPWFERVLQSSGFRSRQRIVTLEWSYQPWASREAEGIRIRRMTEADLPDVARVDAASFDPLWHNSQESLRRAFLQSMFATVAEDESGVIGYQLTTGSGTRAHLARLAVHPIVQGRGVGRALLGNLFSWLVNQGCLKLSVNTQSDNQTSLKLYQRMGFFRTGEAYPVYTFDVPAYSSI
ncbi:MAG: GNAT family N-acetyltransferase [Anaerolineales bacterium]|nr:GNAT family N-acetyltransferase [Anaerolineales bacterium]NUQ83147.1 GNAT family N-acetyltransferase [Anaerolineales bacterium]